MSYRIAPSFELATSLRILKNINQHVAEFIFDQSKKAIVAFPCSITDFGSVFGR
jgi:hypothetical protein